MRLGSLRLLAVGAAAAIGAALVYLLDPVHGSARRRATREWMTATLRAVLAEPRVAPARQESPPPVPEAPPILPSAAEVRAAADREIVWWREDGPTPPAVVYVEGASAPRPRVVAYDHTTAATPPATPVRPRRRLPSRLLAGAAAASASSAIVLAGWAVVLESQSEPTNAANPPRSGGRAVGLLAQPDARRIPVRGSHGALVLVVGRGGQAALLLADLARAPAGRAYEVWVIRGSDAAPAGLFSGGERVVPLARAVPMGATVAVTLERARGVRAPTSRPLFAARLS